MSSSLNAENAERGAECAEKNLLGFWAGAHSWLFRPPFALTGGPYGPCRFLLGLCVSLCDLCADNPETRPTRTVTDKNSTAYNRAQPDDVPVATGDREFGRDSPNPDGGGGNDLKRLLLGHRH
jgi:hypothetical protein